MEVEIPLKIEESDGGMKLGNFRLHTAKRKCPQTVHMNWLRGRPRWLMAALTEWRVWQPQTLQCISLFVQWTTLQWKLTSSSHFLDTPRSHKGTRSLWKVRDPPSWKEIRCSRSVGQQRPYTMGRTQQFRHALSKGRLGLNEKRVAMIWECAQPKKCWSDGAYHAHNGHTQPEMGRTLPQQEYTSPLQWNSPR